ncbi:DUF3365 domain-containing protein [Deltaproteobacteria bacterium TL4]
MNKGISITIIVWGLAAVLSLAWNIRVDQMNIESVARQGAQAFYKQILLTRRWNSAHGGVYVPVTESVQPNPYLEDLQREVMTQEGVKLTKINPAYMTRQIAELAITANNVLFHITSLNPIRPENKPASWEAEALGAFEKGKEEVGFFVKENNGQLVYRYMAPLRTEKSCLKCHEKQGYREGDVRGGISVTLPLTEHDFKWELWLSHLLAFLFGALGLYVFGFQIEAKRKQIIEANQSLQKSMDELKQTQSHLIESKKMAALGNLVAGVAHEINTPVGNAIIAATHMQDQTKELTKRYKNNQLQRPDIENFFKMIYESCKITIHNLERAGTLVQSFKQVSVDNATEQLRLINLNKYLNDILTSTQPLIKDKSIAIQLSCDATIEIETYPGLLAQILINLINNSILHGFSENTGSIEIMAELQGNQCVLTYKDDGKGMSPEVQEKMYDPFYTTNKQKGTGLGMNIVYNIVHQKLHGTIKCTTSLGNGVEFEIGFPVKALA